VVEKERRKECGKGGRKVQRAGEGKERKREEGEERDDGPNLGVTIKSSASGCTSKSLKV
jgi:hypothetical protein